MIKDVPKIKEPLKLLTIDLFKNISLTWDNRNKSFFFLNQIIGEREVGSLIRKSWDKLEEKTCFIIYVSQERKQTLYEVMTIVENVCPYGIILIWSSPQISVYSLMQTFAIGGQLTLYIAYTHRPLHCWTTVPVPSMYTKSSGIGALVTWPVLQWQTTSGIWFYWSCTFVEWANAYRV